MKQVSTAGSFLDYLRSGWQISLYAAIDYTGSNGKPEEPKSLHSLTGENQYVQAIEAVGSILEAYSIGKQFCAFGFGGKPAGQPPGEQKVSHCFPLNGSVTRPEVLGTQGIVEVYKKMLTKVELAGPTYFKSVIKEVAKRVHHYASKRVYGILLILTDGILHDMD